MQSVDLTPRMGSQSGDRQGRAAERRRMRQEIRALLDRARRPAVPRHSPRRRRTARHRPHAGRSAARRRASAAPTAQTLNEGDEGVLKVCLDAEVNPEYARFLPGNHLWHMDGTYEEIPPLATLFTPFRLSQDGRRHDVRQHLCRLRGPARRRARRGSTGCSVVHTMQAALFPAMRDCTPEEFAVWSSYPQALASAGLAPQIGPQVAGAQHLRRLDRGHAPGGKPRSARSG